MIQRFSFIILLLIGALVFSSFKNDRAIQQEFNVYFENSTLRIDFLLTGDDISEEFVLKQLKKQPIWAGPQRLANGHDLDLGTYRMMIYDSASNALLYKQGFCSLFNEWQTTAEAKVQKESYYHVNLIPYPIKTIRYVLEKRAYKDGKFYAVKEMYINPTDYFIIDEKPLAIDYTVVQGGNDYVHKIDIAFLAEGYTKDEMKKFRGDVKRIWDYICTIPPFDTYRDQFNVYAVESASLESGTDIPGEHIYKNTVLNSMFYTFDTPRYLTTGDLKTMNDLAAVVPYDQLFVVINSAEYGGGGFYNYYSASTADHPLSLKVAIHEFGHGFAGLADEYYESGVAYEGFYNLTTEPWEPNITTLVAFETKWEDMVAPSMNIPTERAYELQDSVGVYEGGGYTDKGIYSPFQDCRMKSNAPKAFCPVCSRSISRVIDFYTK
ncbi:MAG TPA: peptidase [Marinilabiliales bacterium]|nr:peptidase [Marinilabiliales bacterium]HBO74920.1 peptidase [Marinilabiliales bacterium]